MQLIVVIPTRHESQTILSTIERIKCTFKEDLTPQIVVADCNSQDGTIETVQGRASDVHVLQGDWQNRAAAMNAGAHWSLKSLAKEDVDRTILWFVHADSEPHPESWQRIKQALTSPEDRFVGGAFKFAFKKVENLSRLSQYKLHCVTLINRMRYRISGIYYGDQGLFFKASVWKTIGGFRELPLMEDIHICREVRKIGKLSLIHLPMMTSSRRFLRHGILRQSLLDIFLLLCHQLGIAPTRLHIWYNQEKS